MLLDLENPLHSPSWSPVISLPSLPKALCGCSLLCSFCCLTESGVGLAGDEHICQAEC